MGWSFIREDREDANGDSSITPAMRRSINAARKEHAQGKTISCKTKAEMQQYFDSL